MSITTHTLLDTAIGEAPSPGPSLAEVVRSGRRLRRRSLARRCAGATAVAAAAVVTATTALTAGTTAPAWALATSPEHVTQQIVDRLEAQLPAGTTIRALEESAYGERTGDDGLPAELPRKDWDTATSWSVDATLSNGHRVYVSLAHSVGESEWPGEAGDDPVDGYALQCRRDLAEGFYETCDSRYLRAQGSNVPSRTTEEGLRPVQNGYWEGLEHPEREPRETRYFSQTLSVYPGGDFIVSATERFRAEDVEQMRAERSLEAADLAEIVLDPQLLAAR